MKTKKMMKRMLKIEKMKMVKRMVKMMRKVMKVSVSFVFYQIIATYVFRFLCSE